MRPAPSKRTEHVVKFLETRNAAVDLLQRLAIEYPDIAAEQLKKHREAYERMKKEGRR